MLVLKGVSTPFEFLKLIRIRAIENVKHVGGTDESDLWSNWPRTLRKTKASGVAKTKLILLH